LWGTEERLVTPLLCLVGEDEIAQTSASMIAETIRYLRAVPGKAELTFFPKGSGASSHCQMGGLAYAHAAIFTWLNHTVTADAPLKPEASDFHIPDDVASAIRRYHTRFKFS
jgi:hypothetical protein